MEENSTKYQAPKLPSLEEMLRMEPAVAISQLYGLVEMLLMENTLMKQELDELKARLNKDSHNSHKPPSSDKGKRKPKSLRKKSKRRPGGQPGHPPHVLEMAKDPDKTVTIPATKCERCGLSLLHAILLDFVKAQVFDLPRLRFLVTEYLAEMRLCSCGHLNIAPLPEGIVPGTQYGENTKALAVYLNQYQLLPQERTSEFFRDVFSQPISEGTLNNFVTTCSTALEPFEEELIRRIRDSAVVHFDETGARGYWVHVASTNTMTFFAPHLKRGMEAMNDIGILPGFKGTAVHDGLAGYKKYPCFHALCNAHHQRELVAVKEDESVEWADKMFDLLHDIKKAVDEAKDKNLTKLDSNVKQKFAKSYDKILDDGLRVYESQAEPEIAEKKRGRKKQRPGKNLLDRLRTQSSEVLGFMYDFDVPYDNNQAERDLRMIKVKIKVSGTFRSRHGIQAFCRIRSFISTMKKQGRAILQSISNVFSGGQVAVEFA